MEILKVEPLDKFTIVEKFSNTRILPGSTGFISFQILGNGYMAPTQSVIIRKGKKGRPRIEKYDIYLPLIYTPEIDASTFYPNTSWAEISKIKDNVMNMDELEFLGWATAYRYFLGHISKGSTIGYGIWPKSPQDPVRMLYQQNHDDNINYKLGLVANRDFREEFLMGVQRVASILNKDIHHHMDRSKTKLFDDAFIHLKRTYKNYFSPKSDEVKNLEKFEKEWKSDIKSSKQK